MCEFDTFRYINFYNCEVKWFKFIHVWFFFYYLFSVGTSNVCHSTSDCPPNAICEPRGGGITYMEGQCVCRNGYFMKASGKSRECIQIADYGELCYLSEQCQFRLGHESICFNRQCACRSGAHYVISENACFNSSSK